MRLVIQRVERAQVSVDNKIVGQIGEGALVLFGCHKEDYVEQIEYLADKLVHLRMFKDEEDKMNLSLLDLKKEILVVSQFTLYADLSQGRRPSFFEALDPKIAEDYYNKFIQELKKFSLNIQTGIFGARMKVELLNDGPVTFILDAKQKNQLSR